jgi:hypothetical protein
MKVPKIFARPTNGIYNDYLVSPDLKFCKKEELVRDNVDKLRSSLDRPLQILNIGGRNGEQNHWFPLDSEVTILELPGASIEKRALLADICSNALNINNQFDICFSHEVFEHLQQPWVAAVNCLNLCKIGGLNIHIAPFAWRYHPVPFDCFRYTHKGFESLFSQLNNVNIIYSGYDISARRGSIRGQYGFWNNGRDFPPSDELGGWLENWDTILVALRTR